MGAVSTTSSVPAGTSTAGAQVTASGGGAVAIIAFGIFAAAMQGGAESSNGGTTYRANPFAAITPTQSAPEFDGSRRVNEQDCSKPIQDWSANLKCR